MSSASMVPLESKVVDWLLQLIDSETLSDAIKGTTEILNIVEAANQHSMIRTFSIDYVSRLASAKAAEYVLGQLEMLELVAVNKSISLTSGEILRPDILCFNAESRTLVVFEVKRAESTERQTVTELAGYEQELRNMLPFLGDFEICFVIVARDWTTLLDHAVGSLNAWSGKQCLALRLGVDENDVFELECHLPEAWHLMGSIGLPPSALQTIDVFLNESTPNLDEKWPPRSLLTAMEVIARAGDRAGSHGFMMLWKDVNSFGNGVWAFTLCAIDPHAMYSWCRTHGLPQRESEAATFLDKAVNDMPSLIPSVVYRLAKEAFPILQDRYQTEFEGAYDWHEKVRQYRMRGVPTRFEFWGMLGDYAREFVCNEGVRNQYMPFIGNHELDWTDPEIAIPLIEILTGKAPFAGGMVRCSDAFNAGLVLGSLVQAAENAALSDEHATRFEPWVRWSDIEALRYAIEMKQISDISEEVTSPIPSLSTHPAHRLLAARELIEWVLKHLIGSMHPVHQEFFLLGRDGGAFFGGWFEDNDDLLESEEAAEWMARAKEIIGVVILYAGKLSDAVDRPSWKRLLNVFSEHIKLNGAKNEMAIRKALGTLPNKILLDNFIDLVLPGVDAVVPVVMHTPEPLPSIRIDWGWLKAGAKANFEAGYRWHTIILSQNGTIGAGRLDEKFTKILPPILDPDIEVYFLNEFAAFSRAVKTTWLELKEKMLR